MPQILILGMSHVAALANARTEAECAWIEVVNLRETRNAFDSENGRLNAVAKTWKRPDLVCLSIGGNFHNWFCLLENPAPFTLTCTGKDSAMFDKSDRRHISWDMLKCLFEHRLEELWPMQEMVHAYFAAARFSHVCAPPPVFEFQTPSDADIQRNDKLEMLRYLAFGATPPILRRRVFDLQKEIYAEHAAKLGACFLEPPMAACTPDGFLDPAYWTDDPTHGNVAYGRLVLDQIIGVARGPK